MKKLLFYLITLVIGVGIGYFIFSLNHTQSNSDANKFFSDIPLNEASFLVYNFKYHGLEDTDGSATGNKERTRAVWFSYDQIETIYGMLTDEKNKGVGTDGLRIYFARYPTICPKCNLNGTDIKYDSDHVNRNTLVLVSTKSSSTNVNRHDDYYDRTGSATGIKAFMNPIPTQNNGELCPSHCDGATLPKP